MDVKICPMEACHVNGVAALHAECFSGERWSKSMIEAELDPVASPYAVTFVAVEGDTVLGFVNARLVCGECGINDIAVTQNVRKQGIGTALLSALIQHVKRFGGEVIQLEVRASNVSAIQFYKRHGFYQNGMRKRYYTSPTEDALLYEKGLTE